MLDVIFHMISLGKRLEMCAVVYVMCYSLTSITYNLIEDTLDHVNIKAHPKLNPNLNPKRLGLGLGFRLYG